MIYSRIFLPLPPPKLFNYYISFEFLLIITTIKAKPKFMCFFFAHVKFLTFSWGLMKKNSQDLKVRKFRVGVCVVLSGGGGGGGGGVENLINGIRG